jgi:hypothetical protein
MARDGLPESYGLTRRAMLRKGVLAGLGAGAIVAASASLAGSAWAEASPALADSPDATAPEQWGWAYCHQCHGMWYPANGGDVCPYPNDLGRHSSSPSYNYGFYYNAVGTDWQEDWYWCKNCSGMFWTGNGRTGGACPANATFSSHDGSSSYPYVAYYGTAGGTGQAGWSWCRQCSGLWYSNGAQYGGDCPVDFGNAQHTSIGSYKYLIPHNGSL